jgi:hypothetical protein
VQVVTYHTFPIRLDPYPHPRIHDALPTYLTLWHLPIKSPHFLCIVSILVIHQIHVMFLHPSAHVVNLETAACSEVGLSSNRKSMMKVQEMGRCR